MKKKKKKKKMMMVILMMKKKICHVRKIPVSSSTFSLNEIVINVNGIPLQNLISDKNYLINICRPESRSGKNRLSPASSGYRPTLHLFIDKYVTCGCVTPP